MSLRRVRLTHEAMYCCVAQALSTERQEVMSVLLGTWTTHPTTGENIEAEVQHVVVMSRTDRRKDRYTLPGKFARWKICTTCPSFLPFRPPSIPSFPLKC